MAGMTAFYRSWTSDDATLQSITNVSTFPIITNVNGVDFTKDGFSFIGWCANRDGSSTVYQAGEAVQDVTVPYYAIWSQTYTVLATSLTSVADAIRAKTDSSSQLVFPAGFVQAIGEIETGGGVVEAELNDVNFYDYDGTRLYSYSASAFANLSALPENPFHKGLTAQGWNWTLTQAKAQVATHGKCDIGQMYITDDGESRIYCHFDELFLSPYLGIALNGTVEVDWGDGSATDTLTGTSLSTTKYVQHTYITPGDYIISLKVNSGNFRFSGVSQGPNILSIDTSFINRKFYASYVKKIEIGANADIGNDGFEYLTQCSEITIPYGITSIPKYGLADFCMLKGLVIPSSVTSIGTAAFRNMTLLRAISFPATIESYIASTFTSAVNLKSFVFPENTNISGVGFQSSTNLVSCVLPSNVTSIPGNFFRMCKSLKSFIIPSGVTTINGYAFGDCWGLTELHFKPTTPPAVTATSAFSNIPTICKIYVPVGSLSAYTSATNYPNSRTYTYVEE